MNKFGSVILLFSFLQLSGQGMTFYADAMVNADRGEHRVFAAAQFGNLFQQALEKQGSFTNTFHDLPWISIQYPLDSTFRMITWQISKGQGKYDYNGYLQTADERVFNIAGPRGRSTYDSDRVIELQQWKGGLVYKILNINPSEYYFLTYRILDQFTKAKTLEPVMLEGDKILLGKEHHFVKTISERLESNPRLSLIYSIDANASITYEENSKRFVYDNLIPVQGRIPGQGPSFVPDGSYKAYELENDSNWKYVDKLFDQWNEGALDPEKKGQLNTKLFKKGKGRK